MSKNRIKIPSVHIPTTREEMESLAGQIAQFKIWHRATTASMDEEIVAVRKRYAGPLGKLDEKIAGGMESARLWAEANPTEFGKVKSIDMTQAVIGYRTGQPQLKTLAGWTWDCVLEKLQQLGAGAMDYIRVKAEVNKQALLDRREELGPEQLRQVGVRVVQDETFYVDPKIAEDEKRQSVGADGLVA